MDQSPGIVLGLLLIQGMGSKLRIPGPLVPRSSGYTVAPPPKQVDPQLLSDRHKQWREQVLANASHRCEWTDNGQRCAKAAPMHRMFADHIKERQDGGALYDAANGRCLCGGHHTLKTARARSHRLGRGV